MKHISLFEFDIEEAIYEKRIAINPDLEYTETQYKYMVYLLEKYKELDKEEFEIIDNMISVRQLTVDRIKWRILCYIMDYRILINSLGFQKKHAQANYFDILNIKDKQGDKVKIVNNESLYISGEVGCGKTHLGKSLLLNYYMKGASVKYINVEKWIEKLRATDLRDRKSEIDSVKKYDVLLVDDYGVFENETEFITRKMYELYEHRFNEELTTITTSNYVFSELFNNITSENPKTFERTISRMAGLHNRKIELTPCDWRLK